jgi:osmoprotectant transport system ATP-binding protein
MPSERPAAIRLEGVCKTYNGQEAVQPLDLTVPEGQTIALIGPSGCGKTTLLKLLIGLLRPDAGALWLRGERIGEADWEAVRRHMGYVIQDGGLFPHLTAEANITLMARHLGWTAEARRERVRQLAELAHLDPSLLARYPTELSGGQRQRVALIRALMLDPDVLLLDEPLAALDPMIRYDLQRDLRGIFQTLGKTAVLVTHDMGEAAFFGDEILLMHAGRVVQRGQLQDLIDTPADPFVQRFLRAQRAPGMTENGR